MFYTMNSNDTYHPTHAGEIEIQARAEEKKMALLAALYKGMDRKPQRRTNRQSRIVAMSFCEPRSWTRVLSS